MNEIDISNISDKLWVLGEKRAEVIRPLAEQRKCSRSIISEAANALGMSKRHVYQLVQNYRISNGLLTSLIPHKTDGGKGKSRLPKPQEILIRETIEELYLSPQKLKAARVAEEVRRRCLENRIKVPAEETIRKRLRQISNEQLQIRGENNLQIKPIIGAFPEVKYPLSVIQIDHTLVDIILVDPVERLSIGRPYVTVAIDVYSRCIAGFVLSLEAPSAVSVGLCLTHVAMDKKPLMEREGIDAEWPIHGKPEKIYVDNGADFHSEALTRGCVQHGIQIEYRPVVQPHYGGIIERVIGTLMHLVHDLPGTTFSNIQERGEYDSDKYACLTLSELEHWLTVTITKFYHLRLHKGLDLPPLKRYEEGVELLKRDGKNFYHINDGKTFLIDFLPIEYRLLRREGFVLDHITYYANALSPLVAERDKYGKFLIRRDPRDLSRIYVYLPDGKGYLEVPYRMLSRPAISLFEHRMALKKIHDQGRKAVDESSLFRAIDELRDMVQTASTTTKTIRRQRARMSDNQKIQSVVPTKKEPPIEQVPIEQVTPYEIEFWR